MGSSASYSYDVAQATNQTRKPLIRRIPNPKLTITVAPPTPQGAVFLHGETMIHPSCNAAFDWVCLRHSGVEARPEQNDERQIPGKRHGR
jgi:hypothetical protein